MARLNAILGFSSLLREGRVSEEQQQKDLEIINRSGHHLLGLINNVLDLAKVESGRTELQGLETLPRELVGELRSEFDTERIQCVIARVSQHNPAIGQQLTQMAASFAYAAMLEAVQPEDDKSPGIHS